MSDTPITDDAKTQLANKPLTYNDIATKLLNDKLLLTALELHTELIESGKELRQLKDFFSNPGNFEHQVQEGPLISRSGSQVTLDSLDLTRCSEDGERGSDEKVAVLEFELRKAKETISALRNNLTVATESENSTPDKSSLKQTHTGAIKPHEQRALNFLINEYLLLHGYKLTSITFADENENQDFEDWDDVGLNISKPAELLTLYREGLKQTGQNSLSASCQTDFENVLEPKVTCLTQEIQQLQKKINQLESQICDIKEENLGLIKHNEMLSSQQTQFEQPQTAPKIASCSSKNSTGTNSPERFEIIEKNNSVTRKCDITLEDNISYSSLSTYDWTNVTVNHENADIRGGSSKTSISENKDISYNCKFNDKFVKEIFSLCYVNVENNMDDIFTNSETLDTLVHTLSKTLLQIIPNIILNKREEVIPLIVKAVHLNSIPSERDKLLQQLFNLKKKPSEIERNMILNGIIAIAKSSGETMVENEILPQCWEQITHKYMERRLLVVESCKALIPYVSSPIRNSLVMSILQQMMDDKDELVREAVISAFALVMAMCDDENKYTQCEEITFNILNDSSINVVNLGIELLFPTIARWALEIERLKSDLIKILLQKLNECVKDNDPANKDIYVTNKTNKLINVLETLLPFVLIYMIKDNVIVDEIQKDMAIELRQDFLKQCSNLTNPSYFYNSEVNVGMLLYEFENRMKNKNETWPELDWFVDVVIPDLINNLNHVDITNHSLLYSFINLFSRICIVFGKGFTNHKVRPLFQTHLHRLEQILSSFNHFSPSVNIIAVYMVSILSYCEDNDELASVFTRFLFVLPLCGTPLDCLDITTRKLCELNLQEVLISCLWQGVVHQRPLVRSATATLFSSILGFCDETLLCTKVTPALVTLASDNDVLVRTATIPALGNLISNCTVEEVHDKAYMQLQTYAADNSLRDNHTLLRQLIVTLGNIANICKASFKHKVILPQLSSLSVFTSQMTNQTRKIDMAVALLEAFSNVVYGPLHKEHINMILPGLRCLEAVITESPSLTSHYDALTSMIMECDNKIESTSAAPPVEKTTNKISQNVNQGVEDMKQKVSKIFNKPSNVRSTSLSNLQGIFKKK